MNTRRYWKRDVKVQMGLNIMLFGLLLILLASRYPIG